LVLETAFLAVTRTRGAWLGAVAGTLAFLAWHGVGMRRRALAAGAALLAVGAVAAVVPGRFSEHDAGDVKRYQPGLHVVTEAVDPRAPVARTRLGLWRRTLTLVR